GGKRASPPPGHGGAAPAPPAGGPALPAGPPALVPGLSALLPCAAAIPPTGAAAGPAHFRSNASRHAPDSPPTAAVLPCASLCPEAADRSKGAFLKPTGCAPPPLPVLAPTGRVLLPACSGEFPPAAAPVPVHPTGVPGRRTSGAARHSKFPWHPSRLSITSFVSARQGISLGDFPHDGNFCRVKARSFRGSRPEERK